jgi:AcrR family transcriptional regulator
MGADNKSGAIAAAALRLLEHQGQDAVTMRAVAKSCGVSAMAIYHHFPSRKALLDAMTAAEFSRNAALAAESIRRAGVAANGRKNSGAVGLERRLEILLNLTLDFALERPRVYDYIFSQPREGARRFPDDFREGKSPTFNALVGLVEEGRRSGYFRQGDVWEIALTIGAQTQGLITLYRGGRFKLSHQQFRRLCRRSIVRLLDGLKK